MSNQALSQPMSHSAAYYEYQRSSNSSSPAHYHPRHSPPSKPLAAYMSQGHDLYRGDRIPTKASISSDTSGSSGTSDLKPYPAVQPYRFGSHAERGLMEKSPSSHSGGPFRTTGISGSIGRSEMVEDHSAVIRYIKQEDYDDEPEEKDYAIWILFWLSVLDPLYSLFTCLFSISVLLGLIVISPLRLCQKNESFSTVLIRTVAPVFRKHLQQIHAPSVKRAHTFNFSPTALVLVHIASPIVSLGLAFFAWIAAVFWLFAIMMGNPDGTEKRDDGRATVLGARNYLEKYLLSALKDEP